MTGPTKLFSSLLLTLGLAACQPSLNWRETRSDAHPLVALLPCKPDRGSREVPMGGAPVALDMLGCEAAGSMFAVSHVRLADPANAGALLAGWRTAVLANLHAVNPQDQPFTLPGGLGLAQSVRTRAVGQGPDGRPVAAEAVWFARSGPEGVDLFHAVVYAQRQDAALGTEAETFFAGLRFE